MTSLLGGGIILATVRYLANWRKNNRSFDVKMDGFIRQNKQLSNSLISYVNRKSLDEELDNFIDNNYIACAILGPAGSGKTRFAQNITHRNKLFSAYRYVYINDKNGLFFSTENFKNNYTLNGNRRYIFVFDYYYENVFAINNLLDKATLSGRHKFVFIERDSGWENTRILDRPEYSILMENHNMTQEMLASVFYNQVLLLNKKASKNDLRKKALNYAKTIDEKIDPNFKRPIFAQLIAPIYIKKKDFTLDNIDDKSQLLSTYWYYKFDDTKIHSICSSNDLEISDIFATQLDALLRILLLTVSISKRNIIIEKSDSLFFRIENETEISSKLNMIIQSILSESFIRSLGTIGLKEIKQLFGIVLKDFIKAKSNSNEKSFIVVAELDLVAEWVLYDTLGKWKSDWLPNFTSMLSNAYRENYVAFIKRGAIDFPDLIELLADPSLGSKKHEAFVDIIIQLVDEVFIADKHEKYYAIIEILMKKASELFADNEYDKICIEYLIKIKDTYMKFAQDSINKKEISELLQGLVVI